MANVAPSSVLRPHVDFVKRKTAYELRISHWSSDVCSSDLHRFQQTECVGMLRAIEDVAHRPLLDHAAGVHHHDPVAESGNDAEVVGDHDDGGAEIALQVGQQIEDLRLDGDVEGGGRQIGRAHV